MTLVVGRQRNGKVALTGDTLITENGKPLPLSQGVMKICALPSGVCVGFSGSPELAKKDLWNFSARYPKEVSLAEAVSFFEKSSKTTGNQYLLAFSDSGKLVKISDGRAQTNAAPTQWIGEKDGYEAFREFEAKFRAHGLKGRAITTSLNWNNNDGGISSELYGIMRQVVYNKAVNSIGGLVTTLNNGGGAGFQAAAFTDLLYDWPSDLSVDAEIKLEEKRSLEASGENQKQSTSIFGSAYPNMNLLGYYFLAGKLAVVFLPGNTPIADRVLSVHNVEPENLPKKLTEIIGVDFLWQFIIASAVPTSSVQAPLQQSTEGVEMAIFVHSNTFPPKGKQTQGPGLHFQFDGPTGG
jgi:hypothetical protein